MAPELLKCGRGAPARSRGRRDGRRYRHWRGRKPSGPGGQRSGRHRLHRQRHGWTRGHRRPRHRHGWLNCRSRPRAGDRPQGENHFRPSQPWLQQPGSALRGIEWAIGHGAKILCIASAEPASPSLKQAIDRAFAADIVVVAGVGNKPLHSTVQYPAGFPGVIAAAGVDKSGDHADVSVTGPEVVLAAPAVDIVSTGRRGGSDTGYRRGTGTSDATAIIAGAAALVRSKFSNLSAAEVVHRLTATADDKGPPGRDNEYGFGVINLVKALSADVPPLTNRPELITGDTENDRGCEASDRRYGRGSVATDRRHNHSCAARGRRSHLGCAPATIEPPARPTILWWDGSATTASRCSSPRYHRSPRADMPGDQPDKYPRAAARRESSRPRRGDPSHPRRRARSAPCHRRPARCRTGALCARRASRASCLSPALRTECRPPAAGEPFRAS